MDYLGFSFNAARCWLHSILFSDLIGDSVTFQLIRKIAFMIYKEKETMLMVAKVLIASIFPIYIGSHASLRCPPSAVMPDKENASDDTEEDDIDDMEVLEKVIERGLSPYDAILFPVMGACVLSALYFLIKWLDDPSIISTVLGWYFSFCGIFALGSLIGDGLNAGISFIFPSYWAIGDQLYYVDQLRSRHVNKSPNTLRNGGAQKSEDIHSPFPRNFVIGGTSPKSIARGWAVRGLFLGHWMFTAYIHGFMYFKTKVRLNSVIGKLASIIVIIMYNMNGKAPWLSNLMSFGLCYYTLRILSPTTFWTGSLVLAGLFAYDIFMVFYTPMMITVATTIDVPIKLVFQNGGLLGLGDIVLPGLMIAMALRFDLYLHYLRQPVSVTGSSSIPSSSKLKPVCHSATGYWGDRYWTLSLQRSALPAVIAGLNFTKKYFYASLVGYCLGMAAAHIVVIVFNHGQPALMYLVPTVLSSLWITAFFYGDLTKMWMYNESWGMDGESPFQKEKTNKLGRETTTEGDARVEQKESEKVERGKVKIVEGMEPQTTIEKHHQGHADKTAECIKGQEDKTADAESAQKNGEQNNAPTKLHRHVVFFFGLDRPQRTPKT